LKLYNIFYVETKAFIYISKNKHATKISVITYGSAFPVLSTVVGCHGKLVYIEMKSKFCTTAVTKFYYLHYIHMFLQDFNSSAWYGNP